jgi:hypothetical protein
LTHERIYSSLGSIIPVHYFQILTPVLWNIWSRESSVTIFHSCWIVGLVGPWVEAKTTERVTWNHWSLESLQTATSLHPMYTNKGLSVHITNRCYKTEAKVFVHTCIVYDRQPIEKVTKCKTNEIGKAQMITFLVFQWFPGVGLEDGVL